MVLAEARVHGAGGDEERGWGQWRRWGRSGHGKQRGKCRECREEKADDNTAGQQAGHS